MKGKYINGYLVINEEETKTLNNYYELDKDSHESGYLYFDRNKEKWIAYDIMKSIYGKNKMYVEEFDDVEIATAWLNHEFEISELNEYMAKMYEMKLKIESENFVERFEAAKKGYGLDKLINDPEWLIRAEVARQGYGLYKLINDPHESVRLEVAIQEYCLEKLINDPSDKVRAEVARQGFGLDKLINDKSEDVKKIALLNSYDGKSDFEKMLSPYFDIVNSYIKYTMDEFDTYHAFGEVLEEMIEKDKTLYLAYTTDSDDPDIEIQTLIDLEKMEYHAFYDNYLVEVIKFSSLDEINHFIKHFDFDMSIKDINENHEKLEYYLNSNKIGDRLIAVDNNYKLDFLIDDPSWEVRSALADKGYALDILKNDSNWRVRRAVVNQGHDLKKFIDDPSIEVGYALSEYCKEHNIDLGVSVEDLIKNDDNVSR